MHFLGILIAIIIAAKFFEWIKEIFSQESDSSDGIEQKRQGFNTSARVDKGGHTFYDGICRVCGCSESGYAHFGWRCKGSNTSSRQDNKSNFEEIGLDCPYCDETSILENGYESFGEMECAHCGESVWFAGLNPQRDRDASEIWLAFNDRLENCSNLGEAFSATVIAASYIIARSDGNISEKEKTWLWKNINDFFDNHYKNSALLKKLEQFISVKLRDGRFSNKALNRLFVSFLYMYVSDVQRNVEDADTRVMMMNFLFFTIYEIAFVDGFDEAEKKMLSFAAKHFGFSKKQEENFINAARYKTNMEANRESEKSRANERKNSKTRAGQNTSVADTDLFAFFGLTSDADMNSLKKAYREMAKLYHPDKYATLPPEFRKVANEKFKEIAENYNILTKMLDNRSS